MRSPEAEKLWREIEEKRRLFRETNTDEIGVICPFSSDMVCYGECPSNKDRSCVNGED